MEIIVRPAARDEFCGGLPFNDANVNFAVAEYLGAENLAVESVDGANKYLLGFLFREERSGLRAVYSGGRFGCSGLRSPTPGFDMRAAILRLADWCCDQHCHVLSVGTDWLFPGHILEDFWSLHRRVYLVADMNDTVMGDKLSFGKLARRSNVSRCIANGEKNGFSTDVTDSPADVAYWHKHCHLTRLAEIGGLVWPLSFFDSIVRSGKGVLYALRAGETILGGCFALQGADCTELIMMSTPLAALKQGANCILTRDIYLDAAQDSVRWVNWQSSGTSGVAQFKRDWNCREVPMRIYSRRFEGCPRISEQFLRNTFPDRFIFPYDALASEYQH